jgi:hypothetical protein
MRDGGDHEEKQEARIQWSPLEGVPPYSLAPLPCRDP